MVSNKNINKVYPKGKPTDIASALERNGIKETAKKVAKSTAKKAVQSGAIADAIEWLPLIGGAFQTGKGVYRLSQGDKGGLADVALGGISFIPGIGYVTNRALKAGKLVNALNKLNKVVKPMVNRKAYQIGTPIATEFLGNGMFTNNDVDASTIEGDGSVNGSSTTQTDNNNIPLNYGGYGYSQVGPYQNSPALDSIGQYINAHTGNYQGQEYNKGQQSPQAQQESIKELLDYYNQLSGYNRPYQQELEKYIDNYYDLKRKDFNLNRYLAADKYWNGMTDKYNPSDVVAQRIDLINKLNQSRANELRGAMEMIGGAKMAQDVGLPIASILANDKYMKNVSTLSNARANADARKYAADTRLIGVYLANEQKTALANGDYYKALAIEGMRNRNGLQQTFLGNIPYVQPNSLDMYIQFGQQFGLPVNLTQPNNNGMIK